jgi:hypothetical protein
MWLQGSVFGFVDKEDANRILSSEPAGSCLLRFSERCNGQVAAAFSIQDPISKRMNVVHVLISPKDCESIAEFLFRNPQFLYVPLARTSFGTRSDNCTKGSITRRDLQLQFCSSPEAVEAVPPIGYNLSVEEALFL